MIQNEYYLLAYEFATSLAPFPKAESTNAMVVMARIQSYLAVISGIAMVEGVRLCKYYVVPHTRESVVKRERRVSENNW